MNRPVLKLKKARSPEKLQAETLNKLIYERFLKSLCTKCGEPVPVPGFALCDSCWKTAPKKFKRDIGRAEAKMNPQARQAKGRPPLRWFKLMRWNARRPENRMAPKITSGAIDPISVGA